MPTPAYNPRIHKKPSIFRLTIHGKHVGVSPGKWIGESGGQGVLSIDAFPGDIILTKGKLDTYYKVNNDGKLAYFAASENEAFDKLELEQKS